MSDETSNLIKYDDFAKLDLRVATVLACKPHGNADKLLVLQVDLGTERRQICAGLRAFYPPEQLVGRQIIIVANLEPRVMRGEISQGMLLATTDTAANKVIIVGPRRSSGRGQPGELAGRSWSFSIAGIWSRLPRQPQRANVIFFLQTRHRKVPQRCFANFIFLI